ncbi:hypothetical protein NBRC116594_17440 [Shimia sp. NS0008-38b]|uniref:GNAT family N-acetyltransferase n=1 Tax=Shimia sp. NS0008-38b TaxID=3127653 RepID=UPI003105205A
MAEAAQPRLAQAGEASAIARLIDAAYQPYRDQGVALPDVSGGVDEAIADGQVWVIEKTSLQGVLMLSTAPPIAHLTNVAVAQSTRGQGLGGALIQWALQLSTSAGCSEISLATHVEMPGNIALYAHLGWRETERDDRRVMMVRALP